MANELRTSGVFSLGALGGDVAGYEIDHSLQLDGSADYLSYTPSTTSTSNRFTLSMWLRRDSAGSIQYLFAATPNTSTEQAFRLNANNRLFFFYWNGSSTPWAIETTETIADYEWHHVVLAVDTAQSGADKVKMWIDGTPATYGSAVYPSGALWFANSSYQHDIAAWRNTYNFSGQLAEVHFVDGQALTASDFGETVGGTWYPKAYTGTYGNNGFYLDFADNNTASALGTDVSGNGNNFSVTSIATSDQLTDVPSSYTITRPTRRWGGMTGRSLVAVPAFPAGSDFKISNGTVTGATYNGSGPTGSGYSSHWDTSSGSNYFSWTPSNASAPTAFTVIVDFETTDTTGAYKQIASFDVSHPNERASFHAYQTDIGWYDGSVKTFGLTYAANTRYVAIAVFNGSVITAYLVDTAAGTIVTSADITAAKGTSTVTPGYTTAWNTPSAIGRHNFYAAEYLSGQVYGGAYWPSALTEAQLVDAINHIRGQIALPTTGVLSLAEHYQSKL